MNDQAVFALRGNILYSAGPNKIASHPESWLVSEGGKVAGIFQNLPEKYTGIPKEDFSGRLIIPGLVDLHLHAPQYSFRGLGMDLELLDWLETNTFPEESKYRDLEYAAKAYQIFADALAKGATTRACVFATVHTQATLMLMDLLELTGINTLVGKVNMDRNCPENLLEQSAGISLKETRRWLGKCRDYKNTLPILTPRFIPSCTNDLMAGLQEIRREIELPVQSHLSENLSEVEWVKELHPLTSCYGGAYDHFDMLGGRCIMAHCVQSGDDELALLKERGTFLAHCPQSNTNLSSGIAPVRKWLEMGLNIGLGTDIAGGYSLSILRAIADAVQVSKLRWRLCDQTFAPLTIPEAFHLATKGGGAFFGKVGSFESGYEFDAVVLDDSHLPCPFELNPIQRLERIIYLAEDSAVTHKYCAGRVVKMRGITT